MPLMFVFECIDYVGFGLLKFLSFTHIANDPTCLLDNIAALLVFVFCYRSDMHIGVQVHSKLDTIILQIAYIHTKKARFLISHKDWNIALSKISLTFVERKP